MIDCVLWSEGNYGVIIISIRSKTNGKENNNYKDDNEIYDTNVSSNTYIYL